jgi:hypothetical protein
MPSSSKEIGLPSGWGVKNFDSDSMNWLGVSDDLGPEVGRSQESARPANIPGTLRSMSAMARSPWELPAAGWRYHAHGHGRSPNGDDEFGATVIDGQSATGFQAFRQWAKRIPTAEPCGGSARISRARCRGSPTICVSKLETGRARIDGNAQPLSAGRFCKSARSARLGGSAGGVCPSWRRGALRTKTPACAGILFASHGRDNPGSLPRQKTTDLPLEQSMAVLGGLAAETRVDCRPFTFSICCPFR